MCVLFLPLENSSRRIDVNEFFDNLLSDFYVFQNTGTPFICGDFSSRCGDLEDFIAGVDGIHTQECDWFQDKLLCWTFYRVFDKYKYVYVKWKILPKVW